MYHYAKVSDFHLRGRIGVGKKKKSPPFQILNPKQAPNSKNIVENSKQVPKIAEILKETSNQVPKIAEILKENENEEENLIAEILKENENEEENLIAEILKENENEEENLITPKEDKESKESSSDTKEDEENLITPKEDKESKESSSVEDPTPIITKNPISETISHILSSEKNKIILPVPDLDLEPPQKSVSFDDSTVQSENEVLNVESKTPIVESKTPIVESKVLGVEALNTHFFDGKMEEVIGNYIYELTKANAVITSQKISLLEELFLTVTKHPSLTNQGRGCYNAIMISLKANGTTKSNRNQNYDSKNNLHADSLLCIIAQKISEGEKEESFEWLNLLVEQLNEMASGLCSQGRTTRLLQVIVSLDK